MPYATRTTPTAAGSSPRRGDGGPSPLDQVDTAFRLLVTGPKPLAVSGTRIGHGLPRRPVPLDELRRILLRRSTPHPTRDAAWRELIHRARERGPAWTVGAAGAALPLLRRVAATLTRDFDGDCADIDAEVLTGFLQALRDLDLERPRIPLRLRQAALRAGARLRYADADPPTVCASTVESAAPPRPWGHPDLVLADAVAKNVITLAEADLIGRTRLENVPLQAAATHLGVGYFTAAQRRWRAEQRLVAAVRSGEVSASPSNFAA